MFGRLRLKLLKVIMAGSSECVVFVRFRLELVLLENELIFYCNCFPMTVAGACWKFFCDVDDDDDSDD